MATTFSSRKTIDAPYDIEARREQFPLLAQEANGHPLAYLDNAATTQKPKAVLDAVTHFYVEDNANVHRGLYDLSRRATERYEEARRIAARSCGSCASAAVVGRASAATSALSSGVHPVPWLHSTRPYR